MEGVLYWFIAVYIFAIIFAGVEWLVSRVYPEARRERAYRQRMDRAREEGRLI